MRFLVESTFKQAPTPELLALIPAETRHGLMLDAQGVRELLLVASDTTRAWQVFRAESPAALQAIANAFKNDPKTIIGLQSEPHGISWACWKNGGSSCSVGYAALGMQGALDAVRATGATNVVTASGIDYANNLSQWLTNRPSDSLGQLMAETHIYGGNACASTSCFDTNVAPVAAQVPVVFGETGETYDASSCGTTNIATFMNWADAHGVGYEAWVWDTWGDCGSLISDFNGTPANAFGQWVRNHYLTTF